MSSQGLTEKSLSQGVRTFDLTLVGKSAWVGFLSELLEADLEVGRRSLCVECVVESAVESALGGLQAADTALGPSPPLSLSLSVVSTWEHAVPRKQQTGDPL